MSGGFSFGTGGSSSFSLGGNTATTSTAAPAFNFSFSGATAPTASTAASGGAGFSFNSPAPAAAATTGAGFSFSTPASSAPPATGLSLGAVKPAGGGFSFGAPATTPATATPATSASTLSFNAPNLASALSNPAANSNTAGGFNFNSGSSTAAKPTVSVTPQTTANFAFNTGQISAASTAPAPSTATPTLNLGAQSQPTGGGLFSMKTTQPTTGISLGGLTSSTPSSAPTTSVPPPSFGSLLAPKTTTAATAPIAGFSLTGPQTSTAGSQVATLSSTTTTTSGAANPSLNVRALEERQNKWMVELKEQEEKFMAQAAHINSWDQVLQQGHDQVQGLKDNLQSVKSDQSRLEAELDFIRGQQEELEQLLEPLEAAVASNATSQHQGDRQRDKMYHLAQNLDGQLRTMTDDLCKVIEHLNGNSTGNQASDPVAMVARILSAHMDTLKWVEQNSLLLNQKVDEISRNCDLIM